MTTPPSPRVPLDDRFPRLHWRLDDAAWTAFERFGVVRDVAAGETVFEEGRPSVSFFLVREGELAVVHGKQELARVGPNTSVGEMGMLLDLPRAGTVRAVAPSRVLELGREDVNRMQEEAPLWSTRLYRVLAECLAQYLHDAAGR
jgi:CRP-like cAMP-binding protein